MFEDVRLVDLLSSDFIMPLTNQNAQVQICDLIEESANTKNPKITILLQDISKSLIAFRVDDSSNQDHIFKCFNNISGLKQVADYIVFVADNSTNCVDVIIVEMKSHTINNKELMAKFRNTKIIVDYFAKLTSRNVQQIKLLLSKPPETKTKMNKMAFENKVNRKSKIETNKYFQQTTPYEWYNTRLKSFDAMGLLTL